MEPVGGQITTDGDEVDRAEWLGIADAERRLSYDFDKEMLAGLINNQ
jgi:hypothetical protein